MELYGTDIDDEEYEDEAAPRSYEEWSWVIACYQST